jgi:tetratricopeptide (TPR) repeat protein
MQQTLSMDPNYMLGHFNLGMIFTARGAYEDALTALGRAIGYAPDFADALGVLGYAYSRAGKTVEAQAVGTELQRLSSKTYISGAVRALYHLGLGERERALTELERAYADRSWLVTLLKVDPLYDELRSEPRFQSLLRRLQFPE